MTQGPGEVVVTGVGLALPGADTPDALLRRTACPVTGPAAEPFDTAARIGRRGHRYKDRATRLALCAALDALRDARLIPSDGEEVTVPGDTVGVVASSNLGNLDTACLTAAAIAERSAVDLSPMSLPNASSNVIASWVAIRHGLRGPNLMLCNGATSGLDAVHWGAALVAAGRVRRAVVIGVETHNAVVEDLLGRSADELLDGAAALVVEGARWAEGRGRAPPPPSAGTNGGPGSAAVWRPCCPAAPRPASGSPPSVTPRGPPGRGRGRGRGRDRDRDRRGRTGAGGRAALRRHQRGGPGLRGPRGAAVCGGHRLAGPRRGRDGRCARRRTASRRTASRRVASRRVASRRTASRRVASGSREWYRLRRRSRGRAGPGARARVPPGADHQR
ncbi:hypothetical protein SANT12839_039150 [Streptomyces antimycoticus]|uniref:Beta-ketoacyl synthase-like N-terminal domain-containing protein n=1 Tax=Streptomyces antimycoticus TaxID=68175 RepID=A0A4D4KAX3_9ACTN|nr:beta-ketoacyl synthase N-terminal-like domain-containing protein [Streptomyces antimycoticus]GDY43033.1 hypothetical protein SANT12839_039150 [Streptomyces antimycoticus]